MAEGDGDHLVEIGVEQRHRLARVDFLHQAGEAGEVGEDEAALLAAAAEFHRVGVVDQVRDAVGRHVAGEGTP